MESRGRSGRGTPVGQPDWWRCARSSRHRTRPRSIGSAALPTTWLVSFETIDSEPLQTWRQFVQTIVVNESLSIRPAWVGVARRPVARGDRDRTGRQLRAWRSSDDTPVGRRCVALDAARRPSARRRMRKRRAVDRRRPARRCARWSRSTSPRRLARQRSTTLSATASVISIAASTTPLADSMGEFDLVVANILAPVLVAMSHRSASARGARWTARPVGCAGRPATTMCWRPCNRCRSSSRPTWTAGLASNSATRACDRERRSAAQQSSDRRRRRLGGNSAVHGRGEGAGSRRPPNGVWQCRRPPTIGQPTIRRTRRRHRSCRPPRRRTPAPG